MANDITTKIWDLDTAGVVSVNPTYIKGISVTFKVASAGTLLIDQVQEGASEQLAGAEILSAKSLGATSAGVDQLTAYYPIDTICMGVRVVTIADIDKCLVYTK